MQFEIGVPPLNFAKHLIERVGELPQFVIGPLAHAHRVIIAPRHIAGGLGELRDRAGDEFLQTGREEQNEEHRTGEDAAHDAQAGPEQFVAAHGVVGPQVEEAQPPAIAHNRDGVKPFITRLAGGIALPELGEAFTRFFPPGVGKDRAFCVHDRRADDTRPRMQCGK